MAETNRPLMRFKNVIDLLNLNFQICLYFYMVDLQGVEKPIFAIIDTM